LTENERQFLVNQSNPDDYTGKIEGPDTFNYGPFCSLVIPEETPTGKWHFHHSYTIWFMQYRVKMKAREFCSIKAREFP
jgi:hypothetical protein